MPARHTIYEDKRKTVPTHQLFICGREREKNKPSCDRAWDRRFTVGEHKRAIWFSPTMPEKTFQKRGEGWGT